MQCRTLLLLAGSVAASANTYTSLVCGSGSNNIPDGTGALSCIITVNDAGSIASGNAVTVALLGLQHEASGDLVATLTHFTDSSQTSMYGSPQYVFYRIGKMSADPNDFGYSAEFGDSNGTGDNYDFGSAFPGGLWATAASLGAANFIPGRAEGFINGYATTGQFSSAATNFSAMFTGQPLAGVWRLDIADVAAGPTMGSTGSLLQWQLALVNGPPPPASLSIAKMHTGNFTQGQQNATYTVTVSNAANAGPTSGTVTVTETVPAGLNLVSLAGAGWACPGTAANNCTRSDTLNGGMNFPIIAVTVNVAANASSPEVNMVSVSGGGSATSSASDSTVISIPAVSAVAVTPNSGSGTAQTFQFQVSDTAGASDLVALEGWFTPTSTSAANSCLIYYGVASHLIYLAADDVSSWSSHAIGSAGTLMNSQCTVDAGGTTVNPSGNNLTLSVPITFKPGFAGSKQIFMFAVGSATNSGWQIMGNWTTAIATVSAVSVTPNTGSGTAQTFQFLASDTGGAGDLVAVEGWLTPTSSTAANTCLIYYATYTQRLYLAVDDVSSWTSQVIGTAGTLQNSQCTVDVGGSTAVASGNNLTLSVPITFKAAFAGTKQIFMFGIGTTGNSGWQIMGTWTPSNATASAVSVTPNAGSGTSQTFQFLASDSGGAADLVALEGWFTPNGSGAANTCLIYYAVYTQRIYLSTDDASGWTSQMIGTAGTLQNSQCTINVGSTTATPSGNNLTLSVPITFKAAFAGAKQVWMYAAGTTGNSGWQNKGTWTVQ